jgi:NAD(P)-dependent dehydrogenase (short-subunit alcohol dehydrogenase family)
MDLTGHVALITGASRGLGRAFAQALADRGARIAITARSADVLEQTVAELSQASRQIVGLPADVTDPNATSQVVATVEAQLGAISLLINNAGQFRAFGPIGVVDPTLWWREIEINVRGPFLYTHAVLPLMRIRGAGRIINIASGAGLGTIPLASAYNVSKTALIRFNETLAQETADDGIRVFAIHPGTVRTPMNAYVHDSPEVAASAPHIQQWFQKLYAEHQDTPIEQAVELVLRLAAGDADVLSGWYLSVDDDIDALVQQHTTAPQTEQRTLRMQF